MFTSGSVISNVIHNFPNLPNIIVELKRSGGQCNEGQGTLGQATHQVGLIERLIDYRKFVETYTDCHSDYNTNFYEVYSTTIHEVIHALGLGHTWYEIGDLMRSTEEDEYNIPVDTCDPENSKDIYIDD